MYDSAIICTLCTLLCIVLTCVCVCSFSERIHCKLLLISLVAKDQRTREEEFEEKRTLLTRKVN